MKGDVEAYYENDKWKVRVQGNSRASSTHDTKTEVFKAGREKARDLETELFVKNMDGKIGYRNSYGNDPRRSKG